MKYIDTDINIEKWRKKKNIAVCVTSGGMDSITMALKMLERKFSVLLCHVNLGQKSEEREELAVRTITTGLKDAGYDVGYFMTDTKWLGELGGSCLTDDSLKVPEGINSILESSNISSNLEKPGLWTPGRNVVLLSVAASLADRIKAHIITLGANQSETAYRDNTMDFLKSFELMLRFGTLAMPVVFAPLYGYDKPELLQWGYDNDFGWVYRYTWSCDEGKAKPCGRCGCCNNRRLSYFILKNVMGHSKISDPQTYVDEDYFSKVFLKNVVDSENDNFWFRKYIPGIKRVVFQK